jgi:hypothetical protein
MLTLSAENHIGGTAVIHPKNSSKSQEDDVQGSLKYCFKADSQIFLKLTEQMRLGMVFWTARSGMEVDIPETEVPLLIHFPLRRYLQCYSTVVFLLIGSYSNQ